MFPKTPDNFSKKIIRICMTGCRAHGAKNIHQLFKETIEKRKLENVEIKPVGCLGLCAYAPVAIIEPQGIFYGRIKSKDIEEIVEKTICKDEIVHRLTYLDPLTKSRIGLVSEIPFYKAQKRIVLNNCGRISPLEIRDYLEQDGYQALRKALLKMQPQEVISEIKKSGLRGRGGAGFPTGLKWELVSKQKSALKYVIANGDEGDPGAFMDRAILEGDPHSVLEGMLISGFAVEAKQGFVYVRAEYPIAVEHMRQAIQQAKEQGFLGKNILKSGFEFDVEIREGAGAFVCGEETALICSLEGKRGMPYPRPPFPAEKGFMGKPTLINNVETLACIPRIILKGASEFSSIGTEKTKGTKILALAGKVCNTGLVEVPFGATLRNIIFDIAGGIPRNKKFKAVQLGGPSGACLPQDYLDTPICYDTLDQIGAIMGSGGMIVLDEDDCMVEVARYFLDFTQKESCGKCPPCRIGTKRCLEIISRIKDFRGEAQDIALLKELSLMIKETALCGLGKTAPNPLLSTLKYFPQDYHRHITEKECGICDKSR